MDQAPQLWLWWLSLLSAFVPGFTRPGWVRFVQWVTGMVLCWEEHTLTQILTALGLESRWRVLERFAAYGAWEREAVERQTFRLIERERPARWGQYRPVAVDDTKLHRTSKKVWGTCTFHESSARSPNRAETVRAHNWVVMGDLVPGKPWTYLPHAARLYCRQSQLPTGESFRTKTALAVELLRQADSESMAPILAVFDGAYAVDTVIQPCLQPQPGQRRIAIITRLRTDARLYHPLGTRSRAKGRPPKWGPRIAAPQHHVYWSVDWQPGRAWGYGRQRRFRYKQLRCRWAVSGPQRPVHVFVVDMAGYEAPWFLVTSALDLSAAAVVEVFAARFRQEDAIRDHKQRLGMEECRAWTKEPILRTFQVQLVALTLLRLLQERMDQVWGHGRWWRKPEWNPRKSHASILDLRRLFWRYRGEFAQFLLALEELENLPQTTGRCRNAAGRVA
ncbi:MAG: transposase [Pseudomonadota bacterium]|nr:transposase [Pseudomonadota bacterium]